MAAKKKESRDLFSFDQTSITEISVDSTTQQLIFSTTGDPEEIIISNPSSKLLFLKAEDNTANKRGIVVGPLSNFIVELGTSTPISFYGIMDMGGSVTISVSRAF